MAIGVAGPWAGMLRDAGPRTSWSLGRCQMFLWTVLIALGFLYIWVRTGATDTITSQSLVLLGIAAGTALGSVVVDANKNGSAVASIVDARQLDDNRATEKSTIAASVFKPSGRFFPDLFQDANGWSLYPRSGRNLDAHLRDALCVRRLPRACHAAVQRHDPRADGHQRWRVCRLQGAGAGTVAGRRRSKRSGSKGSGSKGAESSVKRRIASLLFIVMVLAFLPASSQQVCHPPQQPCGCACCDPVDDAYRVTSRTAFAIAEPVAKRFAADTDLREIVAVAVSLTGALSSEGSWGFVFYSASKGATLQVNVSATKTTTTSERPVAPSGSRYRSPHSDIVGR